MEFALHRPGPPLDVHVESLTFFAGVDPRHHREKLLPDGAIEIIVDVSERPKAIYASEHGPMTETFRHAWISGMRSRPIVIEAQPLASMLVIRFRPGGAHAFLRHDAQTLSNGVFPLDAVLGVNSLRDRILEAGPARFVAVERWLREHMRPDMTDHSAVASMLRRLARPAGLRIADLAEETGYSERHVSELFRKWVGMTPKQYARLRRFQTVLERLAQTGREDVWFEADPLPRADWAAVAHWAGYADQSHLTHEFQTFAGMTPGAYLAAYRGMPSYLPITLPATSDFYKTAGARS